MPASPPLAALRVLDLADDSLTYAGRLLADLGADVVLVEPPGGGQGRRRPPFANAADGTPVSLHFAYMGAGKRAITLDLEADGGPDLFLRLAASADVVLSTSPPGHLDDLGLDYETLRAANPKIILTSVTPFGLTGPRRHWRGSDLTAWALSGVLPTMGDPDRPPTVPGGEQAYVTASLNAAIGTLVAARAQRRDGAGQVIDISLQECLLGLAGEAGLLTFLDTGIARGRTGSRRPMPPVGNYPVKDGEVSIVGFMPAHWDAIADWIQEVAGIDEVKNEAFRGTPMTREPYAAAIESWVEQLTTRYTMQEFFAEGQRRGIPVTPVNSAKDAANDPHLRAAGAWVEVEHPQLGRVTYPRTPYRFGVSATRVGPPPSAGEHNRAVYIGELGMSEDEFRRYVAAGIA